EVTVVHVGGGGVDQRNIVDASAGRRVDVGALPAAVTDAEDAVVEEEIVEADADAELELGGGVVAAERLSVVGAAVVDGTVQAGTQEEVKLLGLEAEACLDLGAVPGVVRTVRSISAAVVAAEADVR